MGENNVEQSSSIEGLSQHQNGGHNILKAETMSPGSAASSDRPKLQLPLSVDPPGPNNPPQQLVWVVSSPIVIV
jgi:hypothetical protein